MACTNCFNGCVETTSDKCVKYTGLDINFLNIHNGDTLSSIQLSITNYLSTVLNGTGIAPTIDPNSLCDLISSYLPISGTVTLVQIIDALFKSLCSLNGVVEGLVSDISNMNSGYDALCLVGITPSSDAYTVIQALITALCNLTTTVDADILNLATNYYTQDEVDAYVAAAISESSVSSKYYLKMVPYVAYEYHGDIVANFIGGIGQNNWEQIYLCNGDNNTPDKRGRIAIGAIIDMGGGVLPSEVDPMTSPFNMNYAKGSTNGANSSWLSGDQLPTHTHVIQSAGAHVHTVTAMSTGDPGTGALVGGTYNTLDATVNSGSAGDHVHVAANAGAGDPFGIVPPVLGCYYIMYIPS